MRLRTERIRLQFLLVAMIITCCPLAVMDGQVSANVPVTDDVYRSLDRLIAFGLLEDYLYASRPYSRSEVARLVVQARDRLDHEPNSELEEETTELLVDAVKRTISELENQFSTEIDELDTESRAHHWEIEIFRESKIEQNYVNSPSRPVPEDIRYGRIDALINPLYAHRDGKRFVQGMNGYLEFHNRIHSFGFLSVDFTPYFYFGVPKDNGKSQGDLIVQRLSMKIGLRDIELQIGRDQVIWGQGEMGGMLLSNNPRPFDLIKVSTIHPLRLPGFLQYLGPTGGSIFVARLGKNRNFPHGVLVGFSVASRPISPLEIGLFHTYLYGGTGSPNSNFLDPIAEFFFFRTHGEAFNRPGSPNLADHRAGVQFRFDAAALRHTQFYVEWVWDDFLLKILHNSAFLVGLYVPRLDRSGKTGLRVEFRSLARILYRHNVFRTGYAEDSLIIGDPLGPKALAISLGLTRQIGRYFSFESRLIYEDHRGGDTGTVNFERTHERRIRTVSAFRVHLPAGWILKSTTGYEHVWKYNFEPENERDNVLIELGLQFPI